MKADTQRKNVRARYSSIAKQGGQGCCNDDQQAVTLAKTMGYQDADLSAGGAGNLGLGCGNPTAIANLREGESVLDLGSGAGFDAFLARRKVGEAGKVIGVDMTHDMIEKARGHAREQGYTNVSFRLGEIEHLPLADQEVDVILSNCVINLSPEKDKVMQEAFRVLRPGGRIHFADIVRLTGTVPEDAWKDPNVSDCTIGAERVEQLEQLLMEAGFKDIRITKSDTSDDLLNAWDDDEHGKKEIVSAVIEAVKA